MFLTSQFKTTLKKNLQPLNLLPQVFLILLIIYIVYFFSKNTEINLDSRNLNFGFDFLSNNAGFDIQFSLINYDGSSSYAKSYLVGLLNTLLVAFFGIIFATILGFIVGISRLSTNWMLNKLSLIYVELFRNLPLILQIFFWYFVVIRSLPSTEKSVIILNFLIINLQGFYIPKFIFSNFVFIFYGFILAFAVTFFFKILCHKSFL